MVQHARLKSDAGMQVYFSDPQSPEKNRTEEPQALVIRMLTQIGLRRDHV